jgi:hypothetical protein
LTGLDSSDVASDTTADDDEVVITYCPATWSQKSHPGSAGDLSEDAVIANPSNNSPASDA